MFPLALWLMICVISPLANCLHTGSEVVREEPFTWRTDEHNAHALDDSVGCADFPRTKLGWAREAWGHSRKFFSAATMPLKNDSNIVSYAIRGSQLYRRRMPQAQLEEVHLHAVEALLWKTIRRFGGAPDVDLLLEFGDLPMEAENVEVPVFSFSSPMNRVGPGVAIGFPSPHFIGHAAALLCPSSRRNVPFQKKHAKVFWRGKLTTNDDFSSDEDDVFDEHRVHLGTLANEYAGMYDVAYTELDQSMKSLSEAAWRNLRHHYYNLSRHDVVPVDFVEVMPDYRYHVNVETKEGAMPWRLLPMLASGAVTFLQTSSVGEFLTEDIAPWVHYVPLDRDITDIHPLLEWLEENQQVAETIAEAGKDFADNFLSMSAAECYTYDALRFMEEHSSETAPLAVLVDSFGFQPVRECNLMQAICHRLGDPDANCSSAHCVWAQ